MEERMHLVHSACALGVVHSEVRAFFQMAGLHCFAGSPFRVSGSICETSGFCEQCKASERAKRQSCFLKPKIILKMV